VLYAYYVKLVKLSESDYRRLSFVTYLGEGGFDEVRADLLSYVE
jgi:hypothetical protein